MTSELKVIGLLGGRRERRARGRQSTGGFGKAERKSGK